MCPLHNIHTGARAVPAEAAAAPLRWSPCLRRSLWSARRSRRRRGRRRAPRPPPPRTEVRCSSSGAEDVASPLCSLLFRLCLGAPQPRTCPVLLLETPPDSRHSSPQARARRSASPAAAAAAPPETPRPRGSSASSARRAARRGEPAHVSLLAVQDAGSGAARHQTPAFFSQQMSPLLPRFEFPPPSAIPPRFLRR